MDAIFQVEKDLSEAERRFTKTARDLYPQDRDLAESLARLVKTIRQTKADLVTAARLQLMSN